MLGASGPPLDDWLRRRLPRLERIARVGEALALDAIELEGAAPAGSRSEAEAIAEALDAAALAGRFAGGGFAIRSGGEHVVGIEDAADAARRWERARQALEAEGLEPVPALEGGALVGAAGRGRRGGREVRALWVLPEERGRGVGDRLAELFAERREALAIGEPDAGYFVARGFRVEAREGGAAILEPPTVRGDLRAAASVCLLDAVGGAVLIGRRLHDPWSGYWAFPGGGREPGEDLVDAARRELEEETGIRIDWRPVASRTVHVGSGEGERVYAVTNFVFVTYERPEPRPSGEMEARWIDLEEARSLRPMAAGTRRVLRSVPALGARI